MKLYDDPTDDLGPSELGYLIFCVGVLVALFAVIALIGLTVSRWWPWLLA